MGEYHWVGMEVTISYTGHYSKEDRENKQPSEKGGDSPVGEYHWVRVEVTISYTEYYSKEDREARQTTFREGWGFTCG